jgi:hypothetical protein
MQEINGVLVHCLEQEFYHLMHIFPQFCLSRFAPPQPLLTHSLPHALKQPFLCNSF